MTTIVAVHKPGFGTVIGSDRQSTSYSFKTNLIDGKWVFQNGWAVGCSGSLRTLVVVRERAADLFRDLTTPFEFCNRMVQLMQSAGFCHNSDEDERGGPKSWGQELLLASADGVWEIDPTMTPNQVPEGELMAGGSGFAYAMGVGYATQGMAPLKRVRLALEAGMTYDPNSGGEPWIATLRQVKNSSKQFIVAE